MNLGLGMEESLEWRRNVRDGCSDWGLLWSSYIAEKLCNEMQSWIMF